MVQSPSDQCHNTGENRDIMFVCLSWIVATVFFLKKTPPAELNEPDSTVSGLPVTVDLHYWLKCQWTIFQPLAETYTHSSVGWPPEARRGFGLIAVLVHRFQHPPTYPSPCSHLPHPHHLCLLLLLLILLPTSLPSRSASAMQVEAWPKILGDEWLHLADASSPKCVCACVWIHVCVCVWTSAQTALLLPLSAYWNETAWLQLSYFKLQ